MVDWTQLLYSAIAGGFSGGVVGRGILLIWGDKLTEKRDFNKWLITERQKQYSEYLTRVSQIPKDEDGINEWTYKLRDTSLKILLLFPDGKAPERFDNLLENIYK